MTYTPYEPRSVGLLGIRSVAGFRLKIYAICVADEPFERERFDGGWPLASAALPEPAVADGRPGVGFALLHQGRTGDYFVLGWWARENELPTRVFLRDHDGWRPAIGDESFCVWDLELFWREREAYVGTVLAERADGVEAYLAAVVDGQVQSRSLRGPIRKDS